MNNDCLNKNGNCSSMCIPTPTGYICACADGMDMKDKYTCTQGNQYVAWLLLSWKITVTIALKFFFIRQVLWFLFYLKKSKLVFFKCV